jgi:hypothetical protein
MSLVFLVDEGAANMCVGLNSIAKRDGVDLRFEAITTLGRMKVAIEKTAPDLVLLHHNWEGITISKILDQLVAACDEVKVVVFTAQRVKIAELIECVRSGVVDYWERDAMTPDFIFQQTLYYCSKSVCTVKTLKGASGSVVQLAERAERESALRRDLEEQCNTLTRRNESLESKERAATAGALRMLLTTLVVLSLLLGAFFIAYKFSGAGSLLSLAFVTLSGIVLLFLHGKISHAKLTFKRLSAIFRSDRKGQ